MYLLHSSLVDQRSDSNARLQWITQLHRFGHIYQRLQRLVIDTCDMRVVLFC